MFLFLEHSYFRFGLVGAKEKELSSSGENMEAPIEVGARRSLHVKAESDWLNH